MKARIIETNKENNNYLTEIGSFPFLTEKEIKNNCTEEPTRMRLHPWDIEAFLINIHPEAEFQKIIGFGGAFTDTAAHAWQKLSEEKREQLIKAYFNDEEGIGYNFGRCHISSCDFSTENYSYVEEGDETLDSFTIERDHKAIIPFLKEAMKENPEIKLFASPWSPPAYMKTNNSLIGGSLKKDYYSLWAKYVRKYFDSYKAEGIDFWGTTVQNEPRHNQVWESCVYTEEEERELLKNHLGPALEGTGINIICYDHCKERLFERSYAMFGDEKANKYCKGIAYHWYSGEHWGEIELVRNTWKDKYIINSEGCMADTVKGYKKPQEWTYGENYGHELCGALKAGINGFTDWNLVLDENNGPAHNREGRLYCNAPVFCDGEKDEVILTPAYYYIGHFSKFIKRDAVRLGISSYSEKVESVAFKNPDGSIVCVVLNRTDDDMEYILRIGTSVCKQTIKAHSIITAIITE
ncbi:MAG: glucosylceramidase [Ruminococcaceae bacterium]|nr:glucosylceramidase [Oscillospiraceae bacterium]